MRVKYLVKDIFGINTLKRVRKIHKEYDRAGHTLRRVLKRMPELGILQKNVLKSMPELGIL